jgi:hypothetical protein
MVAGGCQNRNPVAVFWRINVEPKEDLMQVSNREIETVVVTMGGEVLDAVSFGDRSQAEMYKRGVRRWALDRGVVVRVFSQVMELLPREALLSAPPAA